MSTEKPEQLNTPELQFKALAYRLFFAARSLTPLEFEVGFFITARSN